MSGDRPGLRLAGDGAVIDRSHEIACEVCVVGSGPAGSSCARELARAGVDVVVCEAGPLVPPGEFPLDGLEAMARLYRDMGTSVILGVPPLPYLQGRAVGGSSVVNSAISWPLPREVHAAWLEADPALEETLPWEVVEDACSQVEEDLGVTSTDPAIAGPKNEQMARGAEALDLDHRPTRRYVPDCLGLGRCFQGCAAGRKMSMDRTYLPDAAARGARIWAGVEVERIEVEAGRARGVVGRATAGGRVEVEASRGVVLAASVVQTPCLLLRSGIDGGPVGHHFQCHPGVSITGRFPEPVRLWEGATQGHEVTAFRDEGIKLESLGFDVGLLAARLPGIGPSLTRAMAEVERWNCWGAAIRAEGRGRVRPGPGGPVVTFELARSDVARMRRGIRVIGEIMLAAGAEVVCPGVHGAPPAIRDRETLARLEAEGPRDPAAYEAAVTHMFGTCRMGSDPASAVVRPDFRHHAVGDLWVADSSVFPTNIGVNPQTSICALATLCGRSIAES